MRSVAVVRQHHLPNDVGLQTPVAGLIRLENFSTHARRGRSMKISRNKLSCLKLFQMDSFFVDGDNWSKSRITFVKQNPQRMEVNGTGAFPPVSMSFFFFVATSVVNKLGSLLCHFIGHSV